MPNEGSPLYKIILNYNKTLDRELAAQRSGLKREAPCYPIPEGSTNLCPYDYNTMLNRIKNLTLIRSPGSKPQYRLESVAQKFFKYRLIG